jgi:hypothetical protein
MKKGDRVKVVDVPNYKRMEGLVRRVWGLEIWVRLDAFDYDLPFKAEELAVLP